MDRAIRITRADNGFMIQYDDPETVRKNRSGEGPWMDAERTRVYASSADLLADLGPLLADMPEDDDGGGDMASAFNEATKG